MTIVWRDHWQNIELKKIVYIKKKQKFPPAHPPVSIYKVLPQYKQAFSEPSGNTAGSAFKTSNLLKGL